MPTSSKYALPSVGASSSFRAYEFFFLFFFLVQQSSVSSFLVDLEKCDQTLRHEQSAFVADMEAATAAARRSARDVHGGAARELAKAHASAVKAITVRTQTSSSQNLCEQAI
jgi:hypothetical protein